MNWDTIIERVDLSDFDEYQRDNIVAQIQGMVRRGLPVPSEFRLDEELECVDINWHNPAPWDSRNKLTNASILVEDNAT